MAAGEDTLKKIKRFYLFHGTNEYKLNEKVSSLIKTVIPEGGEIFDLDRFEGRRCDVAMLINSVSTPPIIGPMRVVVLSDTEKLTAKSQKMLDGFLPKIPEFSVLAMMAVKIDKRSSLFKKLIALDKKQSFGFKEFSQYEAAKLLIKYAADRGKTLNPQVADMLVTIFGSDPYRLENEIEKLSLFTGESSQIEKKDLAFSAGFSKVETPYDLPNLIISGQPDAALELAARAMVSGTSEMQILYILKSHFIRLNASFSSQSVKDLMIKLRIPYFAAKAIFPQSKRTMPKGILDGLAEIFKAEYSLKSARLKSNLVIELLIVRLFLAINGNKSRG